ncbi:unnamed protein product [Gongylonema pulchrum]|uniref:DNA polymerase III subunit gamma/tau n=1 Tax=Gongylonema pulchrum TaxID=637853 RepID=A0A183DXN1_9BILA|nr:unnamed protein product [Gongylonema pulchrum]
MLSLESKYMAQLNEGDTASDKGGIDARLKPQQLTNTSLLGDESFDLNKIPVPEDLIPVLNLSDIETEVEDAVRSESTATVVDVSPRDIESAKPSRFLLNDEQWFSSEVHNFAEQIWDLFIKKQHFVISLIGDENAPVSQETKMRYRFLMCKFETIQIFQPEDLIPVLNLSDIETEVEDAARSESTATVVDGSPRDIESAKPSRFLLNDEQWFSSEVHRFAEQIWDLFIKKQRFVISLIGDENAPVSQETQMRFLLNDEQWFSSEVHNFAEQIWDLFIKKQRFVISLIGDENAPVSQETQMRY